MGLYHFLTGLDKPAPQPVAEHSLQELIIADQLQNLASDTSSKLGVAAIYRARQLNADTPASLDVKVGDSLVPAPNIYQSTQEFVAEAILAMQDHGELYVGTDMANFWVVANSEVSVEWADKAHTIRRYTNMRTERTYRTTGPIPNLIVISLNRPAGSKTGTGWMQSDRIKGLLAEQKWSQEYFENNASPVGILSTQGILNEKEAKRLQEQWVNARTRRTPAVVAGGMEWKETSFNASDSEWTQTHLVGIGDVSALSGVPSNFLAYSPPGSTLTYQNNSDLWRMYWSQTLKVTYVSRLERLWTQILGRQVRFDPEPLLIASVKDRVWSATELVRTGFDPAVSLDQVGLPPIPHTGEIPVTLQTDQRTQP